MSGPRGRRAFTLLEVLMAFSVASGVMAVVYFFYFGVIKTDDKAKNRTFLNTIAEVQLERMVRDLQLAVKMIEIKPDELSFRRPPVTDLGGSGFEVNMDLDTRKFETCTYKRVEVNGGRAVQLQYSAGIHNPEVLFQVDSLEKEIFQGWVIPMGAEETPTEVPSMELYRADRGVRSDLERIPLVRIRLNMGSGSDRIDIQTKAFVPPIWAQIVQPNWNSL